MAPDFGPRRESLNVEVLQLQRNVSQKYVDSRAKKHHLLDQYHVDQSNILGSGFFGKVYKGVNKKDSNIQIAIKVVKKNGLSTDDLMILHRELSILSKLDCPNIVKYLENYEDENYIYICMELLQGGESGDLMMKKGRPFNERELVSLTKNMLSALQHCHG